MNDPLVKKEGQWHWVCEVCETPRPVSESKRCGKCGQITLTSAVRRFAAACRNLGSAAADGFRDDLDRISRLFDGKKGKP